MRRTTEVLGGVVFGLGRSSRRSLRGALRAGLQEFIREGELKISVPNFPRKPLPKGRHY